MNNVMVLENKICPDLSSIRWQKHGGISFRKCWTDGEPLRLRKELKKNRGLNKMHILKFYNQCLADGLADSTIRHYIAELDNISKMLGKDFRKADKDDIIKLCVGIEQSGKSRGTKNLRKILLKKLYKIIEGNNEGYPRKVRWIKIRSWINRKVPEQILTQDDVVNIVDVCDNVREKSFIVMLYLSGCRCSELLNLRIGDVRFDEKGAIFLVKGTKTPGSRRQIRVNDGMDIFRKWLDNHPYPEANSLVWMMSYWNSRGLFQKINRRLYKVGFSKHIHAHALRAARATYLAGHNWNVFQLMKFFGWVKPETALWYISLSGKQIDDVLRNIPKLNFS